MNVVRKFRSDMRKAFADLRLPRAQRTASLQMRVFALFLLFALALIALVFIALMLTGVLNAGERENRAWLTNEQASFAGAVSSDFGRLSLEGVALAESIATQSDAWLAEQGLTSAQLQQHPELLEGLLAGIAPDLLEAIGDYHCSGAFVALDATRRPEGTAGTDSRAGLFFKRTEPNHAAPLTPTITCLRGPASIARDNGIDLLGQWQMEFSTDTLPAFGEVMEVASSNPSLPLSRLYKWTGRVLMKRNSESAMLLCLPLVSKDGTVFGVCGLEFSAMLFKGSYSPDSSRFTHVFATLSPADEGAIVADDGLVAGNTRLESASTGNLVYDEERHGVLFYTSDKEDRYAGISVPVRLYPQDSPYASENWAAAVLVPLSEWDEAAGAGNLVLYALFFGVLALSFIAALIIANRSTKPLKRVVEDMKAGGAASIPKTRIEEIDDLIDYLVSRDATREQLEGLAQHNRQGSVDYSGLPSFERFVRCREKLTDAEREIFDLILQDMKAPEIAARLCVSINTIKSHNRSIYEKMEVTSYHALKVYARMLAEMEEATINGN